MAITLSGLILQQTVGIARSPVTSIAPPSSKRAPNPVTNTLPSIISFHTILFAYANGGVGMGLWGVENISTGAALSVNFHVPEINDQGAWAAFWNSNIIACYWPPNDAPCPPLPQVDFKTRTLLVVSPGGGTWGEGFNLTRILSYGNHLRLEGVVIGIGLGCVWIEQVVSPVLVVDIPKTQLSASLYSTGVAGPSCPT